MKTIEITRGLFVKVDDADFEKMNAYNWYLNVPTKKNGRQSSLRVYTDVGDKKIEFGEYLTGMDSSKFFLSFKNHDRLDFRRENIKEIPIEYLPYHKLAKSTNSSKYKGVFFVKQLRKYEARIKYNGKIHIIGRSEDEDEAGRMYNDKMVELFGEYAFQNIIGEDNRKQEVELDIMKQSRNRKTIEKDYSKEFRGVTKSDSGNYWATIQQDFIGTFKTEEDAAYAYNVEAIKRFGDTAILNELPEGFVGEPKLEHDKILLFGKEYNTVYEIATKFGLNPQTLKRRIEFMTLEEAVKLPKGFRIRKK